MSSLHFFITMKPGTSLACFISWSTTVHYAGFLV
jgi:hypothetical protein